MKLNKFFVIALAMAGLACSQKGGEIQNHATVTVASQPDAGASMPLVIPKGPTAAPSGGGEVVEAYGTPQPDGGPTTISKPDAGTSDTPSTTECDKNWIYECPEVPCLGDISAVAICNNDGNFIRFGSGAPNEICTCPDYTDDAGVTMPPVAMPDAARPDLVIIVQPDARLAPDVSRPDVSPDLSTKPDTLVQTDTFVPVFIPQTPQPDASQPDTKTPEDTKPPVRHDCGCQEPSPPPVIADAAPDTMPDVQPDTTSVDTMDAWSGYDLGPDTTPDTTPIPPPVCTSESPTNVISIALSQSEQCSLTVNWNTSGCSSMGYKVIWSKNPGPTYPCRDGDSYEYFSDPTANHLQLTGLKPGTYFVRVCQYLGGACGVYSNEVSIIVH